VQSSLNVDFGYNDHTIRELMKFIELTSRKYEKEDVTWDGGVPNYKRLWR
jgi:hypothetical protein